MAINPAQGLSQLRSTVGNEHKGAERSGGEPYVRPVAVSKEAPSADTRRAEAAQQEARVKNAAQQLNDFMKHYSIELNFSIDSDSKEIVVKVLNKQTGELIRQIPSEEALKLAKAMDTLQGLIIQKSV
jgi:flagellar protein FlaG